MLSRRFESEDYEINIIEDLESKERKLNDEEIVKYDILLETFEKLANHLHKGKLNPKELYTDWDLKPKEIALSPLLEKRIKRKLSLQLLRFKKKPNHIVYQLLKKSLVEIDKFPNVTLKNKHKKQNYYKRHFT